VYSRSAWDAQEGFGGAQGVLNAVELVMYGLYATILYNHGVKAPSGTGVQVGEGVSAWFAGGVKVRGAIGNRAVLIGFAASVMTLSKTVLYCEFPQAIRESKRLTSRQISTSTSRALRVSSTMIGLRSSSSTAS
jgi:hypothetical protein